MRVITFSRQFQVSHPRKGEPTYFVEKILTSIGDENFLSVNHGYKPKHHTIRAGNRWKVGDWFSPRVWSGKPYASKQIEFAPPIQIKKVWPITIEPHEEKGFAIHIGKRYVADYEGTANITQKELAGNDGLSVEDFLSWFNIHLKGYKGSFTGQILCWSESINY